MLKEKCRSLCTSITISMWNAIVVKCVEDRSVAVNSNQCDIK